MEITYKRYINADKNNRVEFLLINWDYEDGSDYLAKIFCKKFGMLAEEKVDYLYFSIIKLYDKDQVTYELLWHEDFGNMIYATEQSAVRADALAQRLKVVLSTLNEKIKSNQLLLE